jgi:hypothetical protein
MKENNVRSTYSPLFTVLKPGRRMVVEELKYFGSERGIRFIILKAVYMLVLLSGTGCCL